jgi:hypothetical protein
MARLRLRHRRMEPGMAQPYAVAGIEPPLEEVSEDPITLLVMRRDGIGVADVRRAVAAGLMGIASPPPATAELRGMEPALELPTVGTDIPTG